MSLIVSQSAETSSRSQSNFEIPSEGLHSARIRRCKDLGQVESKFGMQHRVRFIFEVLDEADSQGNPKLAFASFNLSLNPKSLLYKFLRQLLGEEPPASIDLESLAGTECGIVVEHNQTATGTYANISAVVRKREGER